MADEPFGDFEPHIRRLQSRSVNLWLEETRPQTDDPYAAYLEFCREQDIRPYPLEEFVVQLWKEVRP